MDKEKDLSSAVLMFNWIEYSVFCSMLLLSMLIGVYYGWFKKQDTVAEYMLGGKKMSIFPVTMSMVASHVSGITLLGVPAELYSYGTQFCAIVFCNIAVLFIVRELFLPVFYHLQLNSLYEYLELRFSKHTRTLASLIFAISLIVFIPLVIYVPALAFNQVTGVSVHIISPIVSLICIFYTSFGGLKAVVWTDALQSVFTLGSTIFIVILGYSKFESVGDIWRINAEGGRLEFFNFIPDPFERLTFWTISIGSIFVWVPQLAVHPGAVQRFIAVPTFRQAKAVMFWSFIGFFVINFFCVLVGLAMYATYHDCDLVATKRVQKTGQMLPYYVMAVAKDYPGLTGLFISGVLSAALSTMSAGLNTVAGTLYEDFVMFVLKGKKQSEIKQNFTVKLIVLFLGLLCAALVIIVEKLGGLFQMVITLSGITNGALTGVFSLGVFFPRANAKGAMAGALVSIVTMAMFVSQAQIYFYQGLIKYPGKFTSVSGCPANFTANLGFNASSSVDTYVGIGSPVVADESVAQIFKLSFQYYCMTGTIICVVVGLLVSYFTEPVDPKHLDPQLFSPVVRRFLPNTPQFPAKPSAEEYVLVNTQPSPEDIKGTEPENVTTGA